MPPLSALEGNAKIEMSNGEKENRQLATIDHPFVAAEIEKDDSPLFRLKYFSLLTLFCLQLCTLLLDHTHLGGLTMVDSALLLITNASLNILKWLLNTKGKNKDNNNKAQADCCCPTAIFQHVSASDSRPFLLLVGAIAFQALVFVNFTHALEAIFCDESNSHFSHSFVAVVALNLVTKVFLLFLPNHKQQNQQQFAISDISLSGRLLLHFGPSLVTLGLIAANWLYSSQDNFLVKHLDRYLSAALGILLSVTVFPLITKNVPFLLCDVPPQMTGEKLKQKVEVEFPGILCSHVHVFQRWLSAGDGQSSFNVFMRIQMENIQTRKADEDDSPHLLGEDEDNKQIKISQTLMALQNMLRREGADKVTVEPILAMSKQQPQLGQQNIELCILKECQTAGKTCCDGERQQLPKEGEQDNLTL